MVKGNRDGSWVFEGWERNRVTGRDVGIGRNVCTSKEEGEREKCAALVLTSHSTSLHSQQIILYNINSSDTMPSTDTSSHPFSAFQRDYPVGCSGSPLASAHTVSKARLCNCRRCHSCSFTSFSTVQNSKYSFQVNSSSNLLLPIQTTMFTAHNVATIMDKLNANWATTLLNISSHFKSMTISYQFLAL